MAGPIDGTKAIREGQSFDAEAARAWSTREAPELAEPWTVTQFPSGWSNLTYLVQTGGREYVLRRPPPGVKIKSAHDMGREVRILSALSKGWNKAPRPVVYCADESVIGTPFYVMERVKGMILRADPPAGLDLGNGLIARISESMVETLAEIHALDVSALGLGDLGKPEGYVERQVKGWAERYLKSKTDEIPALEEVAAWLAANIPPAGAPTLVHNDFKYDNVVLDAESPTRILAVLDWEMCTLGEPLSDLGVSLGYWVQPDDPPVFQAMRFGLTAVPGNLTRAQFVERYAARTGRDVTHVPYYFLFALFKTAVVAQQLYKRFTDGLTKDPRHGMAIHAVRAYGDVAARVRDVQRIDRLME